MSFSTQFLYEQLLSQPFPAGYQVAFSGGLDSTVLLHAMAVLRERLAVTVGAVHVHHGLQAEADDWIVHCRRLCADLDMALEILYVDARPVAGESPEAAARHARYTALADWLPTDQCLLTAQHQDDQAETLLLQLLRGGGVHGLAAMPAVTEFGSGAHLRPLLKVGRPALHEYAEAAGLNWVEDPSNAGTGPDRNFLRHEIMPILQSRWPALSRSVARSAAHVAEAAGLLDEMASADCMAVSGRQPATLSVAALNALPLFRRRNVLRYWLRWQAGTAPSTAVLARMLDDLLGCRPDAEPCVHWGQHRLRRYRDDLYVLPFPDVPDDRPEYIWNCSEPLTLEDGSVLSATRTTGQGLRHAAIAAHGVHVRWRQGGERCRPAARGHSHSLKKLFQEAGIPPWQRGRIPLLYIDDRLAAVADLWICEPFQAGPLEDACLIHWQEGGS